MSFLRSLFGSSKNENNSNNIEDYLEFTYRYEDEGSYLENFNSGKEKHFEFEVNVTIEFLWIIDDNMYEVNYYVSSPTVTDTDVPDYDKFKEDVYRDLGSKRINLDYIPDSLEWNMFF